MLPPGYKGKVPAGYQVVRSRTFSNGVIRRGFLEDSSPKPGVDRVKKFTRLRPLAAAANPPSVTFVDMSGTRLRIRRGVPQPPSHALYDTLEEVVDSYRQRTGAGAG